VAGRTWDGVVDSRLGRVERPGQPRLHPYHPLWAPLSIALDIFVIWMLAAHGRDVRPTATDHQREATMAI
jgi:hypothetical protein